MDRQIMSAVDLGEVEAAVDIKNECCAPLEVTGTQKNTLYILGLSEQHIMSTKWRSLHLTFVQVIVDFSILS